LGGQRLARNSRGNWRGALIMGTERGQKKKRGEKAAYL